MADELALDELPLAVAAVLLFALVAPEALHRGRWVGNIAS